MGCAASLSRAEGRAVRSAFTERQPCLRALAERLPERVAPRPPEPRLPRRFSDRKGWVPGRAAPGRFGAGRREPTHSQKAGVPGDFQGDFPEA